MLFGQTARQRAPEGVTGTPDFAAIRKRAEKRKGGDEALKRLLPESAGNSALAQTPDNRILSCMSQRIFCAGFVWSVIDRKWPGFEAAFENFEPGRLALEPDELLGPAGQRQSHRASWRENRRRARQRRLRRPYRR